MRKRFLSRMEQPWPSASPAASVTQANIAVGGDFGCDGANPAPDPPSTVNPPPHYADTGSPEMGQNSVIPICLLLKLHQVCPALTISPPLGSVWIIITASQATLSLDWKLLTCLHRHRNHSHLNPCHHNTLQDDDQDDQIGEAGQWGFGGLHVSPRLTSLPPLGTVTGGGGGDPPTFHPLLLLVLFPFLPFLFPSFFL